MLGLMLECLAWANVWAGANTLSKVRSVLGLGLMLEYLASARANVMT